MASRFQDQERQSILRLLLPLSHPSYYYLSHVFAPSSNKFRVLQFVVSSFCFRRLKATLMLILLQKRILSIYSKAMLPPSLFQFQELLSQLCFFFFRALKTGIQEHKLMWYCSGMFAKPRHLSTSNPLSDAHDRILMYSVFKASVEDLANCKGRRESSQPIFG